MVGVAGRQAKVYLEDTVEDSITKQVGVVDRVWHDIDSKAEPGDQELNQGDFQVCLLEDAGAFAHASEGQAILRYINEDEKDWRLLDRSFTLGDTCKLNSSAPQSGIVQATSMTVKIRNLATREICDVDGAEIQSHIRFEHGDYVVKDEWVGKIVHTENRVIVRFSSGAVGDFDGRYISPSQYEDSDFYYPEQLYTGAIVEVSESGLRRARKAANGANLPSETATGVVCVSYTHKVCVEWQFQNMMTASFEASQEPDDTFGMKALRAGECHSYNLGNHSHSSFQIGDIVVYRGMAATPASVEHYASGSMEDLKSLCTEWEVILTEESVLVQWQDGTTSKGFSRDLVPYSNVDEHDLWPADNVVSMTTGKEGIVQTVSAVDRTALVRWADQDIEEMSLYELRSNGATNIDLCDMVLIVPADGLIQKSDSATWGPGAIVTSISATLSRYFTNRDDTIQKQSNKSGSTKVDWFGQVISMDTNGVCGVLLCFTVPPEIIYVPVSRLIHVSSDTSSMGDSSDGSDLDIDSTDPDSDEYDSDNASDSSENEAAPWVDETGKTLEGEQTNDDWEDDVNADHEGDQSDTEMIDVETEDIAEPDVTDIVLDVQPTAITGAIAPQDRDTEVNQAAGPVSPFDNAFPMDQTKFCSFAILETVPTDHTFIANSISATGSKMKRIHREYQALRTSLPPGILVRTFEARMDLLRVVIIGPLGTPYEYAPMLFDCYLPPTFPLEPPQVHFFSWTNGIGRINPNLYEDGKVCLSLLGTWHGNARSETWSEQSSLLQIFVSLQALVLVREPYYNEAGYDGLSTKDTQVAAANYSERAYVLTRGFIAHALTYPVDSLEEELRWLYCGPPQQLSIVIRRSDVVIANSEQSHGQVINNIDGDCIQVVSKGALKLLKLNRSKLSEIHLASL